MSYDYLLFRAPGDGPMGTWGAVEPESLGSAAEVKARLDRLFPGTRWRPFEHEGGTAWSGQFEQGTRSAEFQVLSTAPNGAIRALSARRLPRGEVEQACEALGLVAVDPSGSVYRPERRAWERGG
jgi:hypothetical protein